MPELRLALSSPWIAPAWCYRHWLQDDVLFSCHSSGFLCTCPSLLPHRCHLCCLPHLPCAAATRASVSPGCLPPSAPLCCLTKCFSAGPAREKREKRKTSRPSSSPGMGGWSFALIPLPLCGQRSLVVRNRKGFVQHIWPHQIMRRGPFDLREFVASDVVRPALAMLSPSGKPQNYCYASRTFLCSAHTVAKACTDRIIGRLR